MKFFLGLKDLVLRILTWMQTEVKGTFVHTRGIPVLLIYSFLSVSPQTLLLNILRIQSGYFTIFESWSQHMENFTVVNHTQCVSSSSFMSATTRCDTTGSHLESASLTRTGKPAMGLSVSREEQRCIWDKREPNRMEIDGKTCTSIFVLF